MLLTPHHFQQSDNYHEELLNSRFRSIMPYEWGVLELQVNRESIANGNFQIINCRAVLSDGLVINIPDTDLAPDLRQIQEHFSPELETLGVHLAIPAKLFGAANFQGNGGKADANLRFWQHGSSMPDETSGTNEQPLAYARANLRIIFDDELRNGYTSLKIAEIKRTPTGQFTLSEDYIPPALGISASTWLGNMLRQLVEILITKSSSLAEQRRQSGSGLADFNTSETAIFWLLNIINNSIPTMAHLFRTPLVHPERLYVSMAELAGSLMTFSTTFHPKDIVKYDHDDLFFTFSQLSMQIRDLLETVIPTRCVPIPLEKTRDALYVGRVQDERLLKEAGFFLGVRAQMPEHKLMEVVPRVIKIASRDVVDAIINSALPGLKLNLASPPPAPIPTRIGYKYFSLETSGPYWDSIKSSKIISIYVPDEIPDEKLELFAVKP